MRHALLTTAAVLTSKPQQRWWQSTNRTIIAFGLLLCVVLGVAGAYLLGLLEQVSVLREHTSRRAAEGNANCLGSRYTVIDQNQRSSGLLCRSS